MAKPLGHDRRRTPRRRGFSFLAISTSDPVRMSGAGRMPRLQYCEIASSVTGDASFPLNLATTNRTTPF
jgi:hypothetical protein